MDKGKTPMDFYQQEVGNPKPQTKEDVLNRFNELLIVPDDHFLRGGIVHSYINEDISKENNK